MALISDYNSLTQAVADFCHRADLANGNYVDYFIQTAQNKIANDVFTNNYGNGIQAMEVVLATTVITGGTVDVPNDYVSPKSFQILDGSGEVFPLSFRAVTWLYAKYPMRQADNLPTYVARDVMPTVTFYATIASNVLTVLTGPSLANPSGLIQTGMPLIITQSSGATNCTIASQISGVTGGVGTYQVSTIADTAQVASVVGGGPIFVFGPFPDTAYSVQGTYYSKGTPLSAAAPTNWLTTYAPEVIHAYCMIEAGKFLKDQTMQGSWTQFAQDFLIAMIERDKAERWASSTMAVETA